MRGSAKVMKGRVEEAAGALSNNKKLRAKGQRDQALGRMQQGAEAGVRKAKAKAGRIVTKAKKAAKKAVDRVKGRG